MTCKVHPIMHPNRFNSQAPTPTPVPREYRRAGRNQFPLRRSTAAAAAEVIYPWIRTRWRQPGPQQWGSCAAFIEIYLPGETRLIDTRFHSCPLHWRCKVLLLHVDPHPHLHDDDDDDGTFNNSISLHPELTEGSINQRRGIEWPMGALMETFQH